jgi:hypothetical protein
VALLANSVERLLGYQLRRASAVMMADLARELADLEMRPAEVTALLVSRKRRAVRRPKWGRCWGSSAPTWCRSYRA